MFHFWGLCGYSAYFSEKYRNTELDMCVFSCHEKSSNNKWNFDYI